MAIAVGILVLVIGTLLFHFLSPWWLTPLAADWGSLDDTLIITFWITGVVFVVVNGFLIWVVIKYRHRPGLKAHYEPESHKLEWWLTVITTVGVIAMLAPGLWAWNSIVTVPDDAREVEVVGQQWNWSFRFPGEDGVLGQVGIEEMSSANPLGLKADDPAGQAPPHGAVPLGRPHADDGAGDGVGGRDRDPDVREEEDGDPATGLGGEPADGLELGQAVAHGAHDPPPAEEGPERDGGVGEQDDPPGHVEGPVGPDGAVEDHRDDAHDLLGVVRPVAVAEDGR